jgi:hypothetical protein
MTSLTKTLGVLLPLMNKEDEQVWVHIFLEKTKTGKKLDFIEIENLVFALNAELNSPPSTSHFFKLEDLTTHSRKNK